MASRALRPCNKQGCHRLTTEGYCQDHPKHMAYDNYRESSSKRGYDSKWRRYREHYLRLHPLCVVCKMPATDVDHRIPAKGQSDPMFWDSGNHQALCHECHSRKTVKENGGFGNGQ